jgi:hypothetical protein
LRLTLDTNCLIDFSEDPAGAVGQIVDAYRQGKCQLQVAAMSGSERLPGGVYANNFGTFRDRLTEMGLQRVEILKPLAIFGVSFFDWCILGGEELSKLDEEIHRILFPEVEFDYAEFCAARGMERNSELDRRWRNARCDVQIMWCHIHYAGEVFVTMDENYHKPSKKPNLIALGAQRIVYPYEAVATLA